MRQHLPRCVDNTPALPEEIILFVTSRCNLRCRHCFYWNSLPRHTDLSLADIVRLAQSLPALRDLALSGGEPFLRKDLPEVCQAFMENCQLEFLEIPTNGLLQSRVLRAAEQILRFTCRADIAINVSLDGLPEYHDQNRGVTGAFRKAVDCCKALVDLKRRHRRLRVFVVTTLTGSNVQDVLSLADFVEGELADVDDVHCGILRGNVSPNSPPVPSIEQVKLVDERFLKLKSSRKLARELAFEADVYDLRRRAMMHRQQPVPCVAGKAIAVVYDNGDVAPCELLPPVGNIRQKSFPQIWRSQSMQRAITSIEATQCACTHECFLYPSYKAQLNSGAH